MPEPVVGHRDDDQEVGRERRQHAELDGGGPSTAPTVQAKKRIVVTGTIMKPRGAAETAVAAMVCSRSWPQPGTCVEARVGIEPAYTALQAAA
jgi:hypothetical protein